MNLERAIGDLLIVGFDGLEPTDGILERIRAGRAGGVILFDRNIHDVDQVTALTDALQQARAEDHDSPLLIAIDQEGGSVARLRAPWPEFPGNMALGSTDDPDLAEQAGMAIGAMLRPLGITLNFSPVLDLASHPDNPGIGVRSFGANPTRVAALGAAMIRGLQRMGIAACAKHFPGMGDATLDAHDVLPIIRTPLPRLQAEHMTPFIEAMDQGVASIMLAHCVYPALDKMTRLPVTVNRRLIQQTIRREFGYEGAVITDCLEMRALTSVLSPETAAQNAIMAGADQLLVCHTPRVQDAVYEGLLDAAGRGLIADIVLEETAERGRSLRSFTAGSNDAQSELGDVGARIAREAIVVVRPDLLPVIAGKRVTVLAPDTFRQTDAEEAALNGIGSLAAVLTSAGCTVQQGLLGANAALQDAEVLVVLTANAHLHDAQAAQVHAVLGAAEAPVVLVAVRNPYDVDLYPELPVVLTYSDTPPALRVLGEVLVGAAGTSGRAPVPLQSCA